MLKFRFAAGLFFAIVLATPVRGAVVAPVSTVTVSDSTVTKDTTIIVSDSTTVPDSVLGKNAETDSIKITTADSASVSADSAGITIPAGTKLSIYFYKSISTAEPSGFTFSQILDEDLTYEGEIIAPKGSPVKGKIIESREGTKLTFLLTHISANGNTIEITTDIAGVTGKGNTANIIGPVSFMGGAFGGGTAGNGAPIPSGLAGLKYGKNDIQIPVGTLMEIPLKEPLVIK